MKKFILIVTIVALVSILLTSCANSLTPTISSTENTVINNSTTQSNIQTNLPIATPQPIPPQPLLVNNVEEAIKLIIEDDYYRQVYSTMYPSITISSEEITSYEAMIQEIANFDYFPLIGCYSNHSNKELTLLPGGAYEDIGIKCSCVCEERIDYFIYLLKEDYSTISSITEYWNQRFGSQFLADATVAEITIDSQPTQIAYYLYGNRNAVSFLMDGFEIRLLYNEDVDITEVVQSFSYVKMPLT